MGSRDQGKVSHAKYMTGRLEFRRRNDGSGVEDVAETLSLHNRRAYHRALMIVHSSFSDHACTGRPRHALEILACCKSYQSARRWLGRWYSLEIQAVMITATSQRHRPCSTLPLISLGRMRLWGMEMWAASGGSDCKSTEAKIKASAKPSLSFTPAYNSRRLSFAFLRWPAASP